VPRLEPLISNAPVSWKVLFACLSGQSDPDLFNSITDPSFNWDAFYDAALRHDLFPLVWQSLNRMPEGVVPSIEKERFRTIAAASMLRSLQMSNELQKLLEMIASTGIPVLPIKGPILAEQAYGDGTLRSFNDLDLLVPAHTLRKVIDLLLENGYELEIDPQLLEHKKFFTLTQHVQLFHPTTRCIVEIHKALFADWRRFPLQFEDLVAEPDAKADGLVCSMNDEDILLMLCAHGTFHQWCKLKWVVDVDRFVRVVPDLDWDRLFASAKYFGCCRAVLLGLQLARTCCNSPLPEMYNKELAIVGLPHFLQHYAMGNWFEPSRFEGSFRKRYWFTLASREKASDRLRIAFANLRVRFYRKLMRAPV